MNDKSIPQELIDYRRYVLKTMWGGAIALVRRVTRGYRDRQPYTAA
jgi:hypothetical protein